MIGTGRREQDSGGRTKGRNSRRFPKFASGSRQARKGKKPEPNGTFGLPQRGGTLRNGRILQPDSVARGFDLQPPAEISSQGKEGKSGGGSARNKSITAGVQNEEGKTFPLKKKSG